MTATPSAAYVASRAVGAATVSAISDGSGRSAIMQALLVPREVWSPFVEVDERGEIALGYNVAHVRLGAASVLIDLGFDDPSPNSQWREPRHQRSPGVVAGLASLGVRPEEITHVAITHAHGDHVAGGSIELDGRWVPRYPNARYFIGRADWESNPAREQPDSHLARQIGPVADAGLLELVDGEREIAPGITMLHAPGESPGHCIVRVVSEGATFYFLGDLFHHPCEVANQDWVASNHNAAALRASRATLTRDALATDALLMVTHLPFPAFGRLRQTAEGVRWVEA